MPGRFATDKDRFGRGNAAAAPAIDGDARAIHQQ